MSCVQVTNPQCAVIITKIIDIMKQLLLLFFTLILSSVYTLQAQGTEVREVRKNMSLGAHEAFVVDYVNLDDREVEKLLIDFLKEYKGRRNPKKNRRENEIFVDDAEIKALSANTIDIYASVDPKGDNGSVIFWFDLGGVFLSEEMHGEKMEALEEWLYYFSRATRARTIELELEAEEDKLDDLNKDFDKLQREQEKLEKIIQDAQEAIAKAEKDLEDNAQSQKNAQDLIEQQRKVLEKVKDRLKKVN